MAAEERKKRREKNDISVCVPLRQFFALLSLGLCGKKQLSALR
jgi:hypothetical protein